MSFYLIYSNKTLYICYGLAFNIVGYKIHFTYKLTLSLSAFELIYPLSKTSSKDIFYLQQKYEDSNHS